MVKTPMPSAEQVQSSAPPLMPQTEEQELRTLRERERQILELLGSASAQRILHDIRNLQNEVRLLRYLADKSS